MSVGNLKDNGNKGNNFPYQINVLKLLGLIGGSTSASATEATLLQVLAAIQSGQEYEQNLVIDKGAPGEPTYLQIRIWDTVNHVFLPPVYYTASGGIVTPIGPLELVNPQYILQTIYLELDGMHTDMDNGFAAAAQEATLLNVSAGITSIDNKLSSVNRTPGFTIDTASVTPQTTPIGVVSFSLLFRGTGGQLNGQSVPDGYKVNFGNGKDPITASMPYVRPTGGTGAEVLISTLA